MSYLIRHTRPEDVPTLMDIFAEAKERMRADGNMHQWTGTYPDASVVAHDMERGASYVVVNEDDGTIVATFACIVGEDPTYVHIYEGEWMDTALPYCTVHRLAARRSVSGMARLTFDFAVTQAPSVRADTHRDNHVMQHLLEKCGFRYCGIIFLLNGDERLAYQLVMER